jgi:hypothetical protein
MHSVDQSERELGVTLFGRRARHAKEVAYCERVGPQVPLLRTFGGQPSAVGKAHHQPNCFAICGWDGSVIGLWSAIFFPLGQ